MWFIQVFRFDEQINLEQISFILGSFRMHSCLFFLSFLPSSCYFLSLIRQSPYCGHFLAFTLRLFAVGLKTFYTL